MVETYEGGHTEGDDQKIHARAGRGDYHTVLPVDISGMGFMFKPDATDPLDHGGRRGQDPFQVLAARPAVMIFQSVKGQEGEHIEDGVLQNQTFHGGWCGL